MDKLLVFVLVTAGLLLLSRRALRDPRHHGFYRFFLFETILILILNNTGSWFREPFSPLQILSWVLLLGSLLLAVHGFYLLRTAGKPAGDIEATTVLVTRGAYRYIRHPLYCSLLLFAVGVYLKSPSLVDASFVVVVLAFAIATARVEEAENLQRFGPIYAAYMKTTKMFIPYIL